MIRFIYACATIMVLSFLVVPIYAGIAGERDHAVGGLKAIGVRFIAAGGVSLMEAEVGVLYRRNADVVILINLADAHILAEEHLIHRDTAATIGDADVSTDAAIPHRGINKLLGSGWAVDVDGLSALRVPRQRHQGSEACGMIIVVVGEENDSHLTHVCAGPRHAPRHSVTGVHNVVGAVYGK